MKVTLSLQADEFLRCAPMPLRSHLIGVIREKAPKANTQMIVIGWTADGSWPHIERAMKDYKYSPGIRLLFHVVKCGEVIHIDRIDWRDNDVYGDGH